MPKTVKGTQSRAVQSNLSKVNALLEVITHGSGDELLTLRELKATGSHPFSNSTRQRKIRNNEYPQPIKLSPQMCLWKAGEIRLWRADPTSYKFRAPKLGGQ
jgi:predicted DNA-binding transcriptional regulator AlpA